MPCHHLSAHVWLYTVCPDSEDKMYEADMFDVETEFAQLLPFWWELATNHRKWTIRDAMSRYSKWGDWESIQQFVENYVKVVEDGSPRIVNTHTLSHWASWGEMLEKLNIG